MGGLAIRHCRCASTTHLTPRHTCLYTTRAWPKSVYGMGAGGWSHALAAGAAQGAKGWVSGAHLCHGIASVRRGAGQLQPRGLCSAPPSCRLCCMVMHSEPVGPWASPPRLAPAPGWSWNCDPDVVLDPSQKFPPRTVWRAEPPPVLRYRLSLLAPGFPAHNAVPVGARAGHGPWRAGDVYCQCWGGAGGNQHVAMGLGQVWSS